MWTPRPSSLMGSSCCRPKVSVGRGGATWSGPRCWPPARSGRCPPCRGRHGRCESHPAPGQRATTAHANWWIALRAPQITRSRRRRQRPPQAKQGGRDEGQGQGEQWRASSTNQRARERARRRTPAVVRLLSARDSAMDHAGKWGRRFGDPGRWVEKTGLGCGLLWGDGVSCALQTSRRCRWRNPCALGLIRQQQVQSVG